MIIKKSFDRVVYFGLFFVFACVVFGFGWWRMHHKVDDQKIIAIVTTTTPSFTFFMHSIMQAVELCAQKHNIAIKRYETDGSAQQTLHAFQKLYADGVRKVVGPILSESLNTAVQVFIAQHTDMVVVSPSVTSSHIGEDVKMPNFFRFVMTDDRLMAVYSQLFFMRMPDLKHLIIMARDDMWGQSIAGFIRAKVTKILPQALVHEFFYKVPESFSNQQDFKKYLSTFVGEIRTVLKNENGPKAVLLASFVEAADYVRLVHDDNLFNIRHFGALPLTPDDPLFKDKLVVDFLIKVKFESLEFSANNALSTKRYTFLTDLIERLKEKNVETRPSIYSFFAYDAARCLSLCKKPEDIRKILKNFYGASGYIEVDDGGNRTTGMFVGVGVVSDGGRWRLVPLSLNKQEVNLASYGVIEQCGIVINQPYEIIWDKKWDVTIQTIRYDLTGLTEPFTSARNHFTALISEYVIVHAKQGALSKRFIIFPSLAKNGIQGYMNMQTHAQWMKKAPEKLYLADGADHPIVVREELVAAQKGK